MKKTLFFIGLLGLSFSTSAQENDKLQVNPYLDSLTQQLEEVILISNATTTYLKNDKALGSLDSYLEESNSVDMIRRGAYAWEPMLNGMSSDRSIITIDGMRVYQACTDRMDPITSYVENTNLSSTEVKQGQYGGEYGATIAGGLNLERRRSGFQDITDFSGTVFGGFESSNLQQIYGTTLSYAAPKFYSDVDFTYRHAKNYKAGYHRGQSSEVLYSQYEKYNISAIVGYKLTDNQSLEASVIFDEANDVGYPGLAMDVRLAQALMGSVQYRVQNLSEHFSLWETKVYFNTITHIMDDSHRPEVPIRMDMPGWSKTQGFYSQLIGSYGKHHFKATLTGHRNNSLAEMTMYPNNPAEPDMFMLTWPDVNTFYGGLHLEDQVYFSPHLKLRLAGSIGVHHNDITSTMGLNSLQIFYPNLSATKTRVLKSLASKVSYHHDKWTYGLSVGYGERAPSITEAYGFYLLNLNDNFDYVGNPYLDNEKSINAGVSLHFENRLFDIEWRANYFHLMDYIIGKPEPGVSPMNPQAEGVKIYRQLNYAHIFNTGLNATYYLADRWTVKAQASYRYGQGAESTRLPLIQPLNYSTKLRYSQTDFFAELGLEGSTKNRNSIEFGELQKPAYTIFNFAASQEIHFGQQDLTLKAGVQNIFDKYYSTYADWIGIPRLGRNVYLNAVLSF